MASPAAKIAALRDALPASGFFAEKEWLHSPEPFPLSPRTFRELEALGPRLHRFLRAANTIHQRSLKGTLPPWIAAVTDTGKPEALLEIARDTRQIDALPRVIRPDLVLTEDGFALTEIDAVPGGIGLTAWLGKLHAGLAGDDSGVIGGATGMLDGFASIFPGDRPVEIAVSAESADYRPEMEWLAGELGNQWSVVPAETAAPGGASVYRFFELFDLPNLPGAPALAEAALRGEIDLTAPFKPFLEEKSWLALFWMRPLQEIWRRELRDSHWRKLREIIPYGWVVDPAPLPHHAVLPRLDLQDFRELAHLSQTERNLVLKISGFSELGWGSRSVRIGSDLSQSEWAAAVERALSDFPEHPHILQEFHPGRLVEHPFWNDATDRLEILRGRVRLCPYYFVSARERNRVRLGGVLATVCPADKKILHGMRDAILVPCAVREDGY